MLVTVLGTAGCAAGRPARVPVDQSATATRGTPLRDPPQYASRDGVLRVRIVVERRQVEVAGRTLSALTYNGFYMPPTLRLSPGDRMDFTMVNKVHPLTDLYLNGLRVSPPGRTGNPFLHVPPDRSFHYVVRFPRTLSPGTYWYHSYEHPYPASQAIGGMSGIIIVDGLRRHLPPSLQNITEHVMALKDFPGGGAVRTRDVELGSPADRTVNGQVNPVIRIRPGETQLWRLANISAGMYYRLHLAGQSFRVIAQDANPVDRIWSTDSLVIPAGARFDVLVEGGPPGHAQLETLPYSSGPAGDRFPQGTLATAISAGTPVQCAALPLTFASMEDLSHVPVAARHTVVLPAREAMDRVRAGGGDLGAHLVDFHARPNTVEEWTLHNAANAQQPFHVHTNAFQVMSVNGRAYTAHSRQDTVNLPEHGQVVIRIRFAGHAGGAGFHCRLLDHEAMGRSTVLQMLM